MNTERLGCMGCYMGEDIDATGFDWDTGEYANGADAGGSSGISPEAASVWTGLFDSIASITTGAFSVFGGQQPVVPGAPAPSGSPAYPPPAYMQPARMDPVMIAAIGIPAALILFSVMKKK